MLAGHARRLIITRRRPICLNSVVRTPPSKPFRSRSPRLEVNSKQHVPSDSFGGLSPEKKASQSLRTLFTFIAVRIILAQLEGSGRGALGSYNSSAYEELTSFLAEEPLRDGDAWVAKLMRRNGMLALRVLEVRLAYCNEDFEYDQLEKLTRNDMKDANTSLMRKYAEESLSASLETNTTTQPSEEGV